ATPATNSYSDTGLSPSTLYSYAISAYDAAGNVSAQSTSASATTQASEGGINCDLSTLQSAITAAQRGATITCNAGSWTWNGTLSITKGIILKGAGSGNTVVTRAGELINITPDTTAIANEEIIRVEGFTLDGSNSALNLITVRGSSPTNTKPFKNLAIGNNTFRNTGTVTSGSGAISTMGQVRGVIFNNVFDRVNVVLKILGNDDTTEWSNGNFPFAYGNSDNLFFEDNTIQYSSSFSGQDPGWTETGQGSRLAVRYNSWNMANAPQLELWDIHGFQNWPGGQTGTMISEYYGNTVANAKGYRWIGHRGSWGLFFNNIITGTGGMSIEANVYSCTSDVPGATGVYKVEVNNTYVFNNTNNGTAQNMGIGATGGGCGVNENDEFYNYNSSFNGTTGIGRGTVAPTGSCTTGVGYWKANTPTPTTNSSTIQSGTLYKCTSPNTWTPYYTPYAYPHPLVSGGTIPSDTTPPTISITSPTSGSTVSGTITASASASDNVGVAGVQFLLDGANLGAEDTTAPYSVSWNTAQSSNGSHSLTARARDAAGNQTTSAVVSVTVSNVASVFVIGDRVQTTSNLNIRATPTTAGTLLGTQATGNLGTVIGGPISADGFNWWNVNYDNAPDGWSVEDFLMKTTSTTATLFYVRSGATGNGSGLDWTNACTDFTGSCAVSSLVRGGTYYVGSGTYASRTFNKATSGTLVITIKGATIADHGTDTGWVSTYSVSAADGGSQAQFTFTGTNAVTIGSSYWVFDGAVGSGGTSTNYGFLMKQPSSCSADPQYYLAVNGTNTTNVTVKHIAVVSCGPSFDVQQNGITVGCGSCYVTNSTFANSYISGGGKSWQVTNMANSIIENSYSENQWSSSAHHGETISVNQCHSSESGGCSSAFTQGQGTINDTFRNNIIKNCRGTACIAALDPLTASSMPGWKIYGNVFVDVNTGNGVIGTGTSATHYIKDAKVYQNTFINSGGKIFFPCGSACGDATGNEFKNNVLYDSSSVLSGGTIDYSNNSYFNPTDTPPPQTGIQTGTGDPFVNSAGGNYHLVAATNPGISLSAPYNIDFDGITRGADGVWDRGAYEFVGATSSTKFSLNDR
ncbi:MAG: Ig-like domain-containing protein, partial [Candidatus Brocadiia bacterium]